MRSGFGMEDSTARVRMPALQQAHANIAFTVTPEVDDQKIVTAVASGDGPDLS